MKYRVCFKNGFVDLYIEEGDPRNYEDLIKFARGKELIPYKFSGKKFDAIFFDALQGDTE